MPAHDAPWLFQSLYLNDFRVRAVQLIQAARLSSNPSEFILKKRVAILVLLLLSIFPISMIFSNPGFDDRGNANDPALNPRANACYEGGVMENKCTTDWDWNCGWYLIRFDAGMIARAAFPPACTGLLSAAPAVSTPVPPTRTVTPTRTPTSTPTSTPEPLPSSTPLPL
jgi:hypothetical protein